MRAPRDAFGAVTPFSKPGGHHFSRILPSNNSHAKSNESLDVDNDSEANSDESFESALSLTEREIHQSVVDSYYGSDTMDESTTTTSSDDEKSQSQFQGSQSKDSDSTESLHSCPENNNVDLGSSSKSDMQSCKQKEPDRCWRNTDLKQFRRAPRAFWPYWVYRMYDSYCLAERAAGTFTLLWVHIQHPAQSFIN